MKAEFLTGLGLSQEHVAAIVAESVKEIAAKDAAIAHITGERDQHKADADGHKDIKMTLQLYTHYRSKRRQNQNF